MASHYAAQNNAVDALKILLEAEGNNPRTNEKATCLMLAAEKGQLDTVKYLLTIVDPKTNVPVQVKQQRQDGMTALILAAHNKHPEVVALLKPYEIGMHMNKKMNALTGAASSGSVECCELLLEEAGEINELQSTALIEATRAGHLDCVKLLAPKEAGIRAPKGQSALVTAVNHGRVEEVKYLAENENELKPEMFKDGWTPLMSACAGNADELIK